MLEIIEKAIRHYGRTSQQIKAVEELSELQTAVLKALDGRPDFASIAEEIADVEIMLAQLKKIFFLDEEKISTIKAEKILRLKSRMEMEEGLQK